MTATKKQLAAAFERWLKDWKKDPSKFSSVPLAKQKPKTYGERCAKYLIDRLRK